MFKLLLNWLASFFTADKVGVLVRKLLLAAGKPVAKDVFNTTNLKKALEFVKELSKRDDLKGWEKAELFNAKFLHFLKVGAGEISESVLNCLREMAVVALKSESSEEKTTESN